MCIVICIVTETITRQMKSNAKTQGPHEILINGAVVRSCKAIDTALVLANRLGKRGTAGQTIVIKSHFGSAA